MQIQPIEQITVDDKDTKEEITKKHHEKEDYYIRTFRTLKPWGLNIALNNKKPMENTFAIEQAFLPVKTLSKQPGDRGRGVHRELHIENFQPVTFMDNLATLTKFHFWQHHCRINFNKLKKKQLRTLGAWLEGEGEPLLQDHPGLLAICEDMLAHRLKTKKKITNNRKEREAPPVRWHIKLVGRGVKLVRLQSILRKQEVQVTIPDQAEFKKPVIVFDYEPKTESKLMNYGKVIKSIKGNDWDDHVKERSRREKKDGTVYMSRFYTNPPKCKCHTSIHCNKDLGHIQTGDPDVIDDPELRELFKKGRKYIEEGMIDWENTKKAILDRIDETVDRWTKHEGMEKGEWDDWTDTVTEEIGKKIDQLKNNTYKQQPTILEKEETKEKLKELHEKYIITSTDKVSGNYSLICIQHAKMKMVQEMLYNEENTYQECTEKREKIIERQKEDMKNLHQITVKKDNHRLGYNYPTNKNHKIPPKMRIILNGNKVITQPLSKELSIHLKAIIASHRKICENAYRTTAVRHMWMVSDMKPVLDDIKVLNTTRGAKNLRTADFPTLYTKIPHDDLLKTITQGIEEVFQYHAGKAEPGAEIVLKITYNQTKKERQAYVGPRSTESKKYITKDKLISMLEYLINNIYSTVGDKTFKQIIGIPMGTDCAPFIANLYLHFKEYNWIKKMLEKDKKLLLEHFNHCFRYLDDFLGLNSGNKLEEYRKDIYGLRIDTTNEEDNQQGDYYNMTLKIVDGRFTVDLYNKTDAYDFDIIQFAHHSSNTNKATDANVIHGQLHNYLSVCDRLERFIERGQKDLEKMIITNGQSRKTLQQRVWRFLKNHHATILKKYKTTLPDIHHGLFANIKHKIKQKQN
jgi:hypothetical protein